MPFIYENEDRFKILLVDHAEDYGAMRWTVDTPADLVLLQKVVKQFPGRDDFTWLEVLDLFLQAPELVKINAGIHHKTVTEIDERIERD